MIDLATHEGWYAIKLRNQTYSPSNYGIMGYTFFSSLKISNKNILQNILEILDQNRISI